MSIVLYGERAKHPWAFFFIVLFPLYAPHGTPNPKTQRYSIRFISTYSSLLPMSFVRMIIQIVRQCCSPVGFFLCKVSASGILQGSALQALSQDFFKRFWGKSAFIQNLSSPWMDEIISAIPCIKMPFPYTPYRSVKSPHKEGCIFKSNNSNFQHHANKCFDISKVS